MDTAEDAQTDRTHELMVAAAGVSYPGGYETGSSILPRGYAASTSGNQQPGGETSGSPSIKWLDSKPLFQVEVRRESTVITRDQVRDGRCRVFVCVCAVWVGG
jgi:hypothetical protein